MKFPLGISTPGLSRSWSPLPVKYTDFPRSREFSSVRAERRRCRSNRRSKPGKERLPRGRRVAQAPGMVAFASLMRTNSLLDLPFLRTVPHSDPKHKRRITRQDTQGDVQSFIFRKRKFGGGENRRKYL